MNIYVGNLSYNCSDEDLKTLFSEYGTVETAKLIVDRDSGRSRGFGFVEMVNENEAGNAVSSLNNTEHLGRTLKVNKAREKR